MEPRTSVQSTIYKYYFFQFFVSMTFFAPVVVLFWQENGLSMTNILLLQSIYSIGVVILELPTGAFADYFGKRKSMILGALFWTFGMIWYGYSHTFWQFAIGELIAGMGSAFISGADRSYIHQVLRIHQREREFKKVEGNTRGFIQISAAAASLIGGFIGAAGLGLTLFATGVATGIAGLIGLSFPVIKEKSSEGSQLGYFQIIKESLHQIRTHRELLWLTVFFAAFNGLLWPSNFYIQPFLKSQGVPLAFFGAVFAGFFLVNALGSSLTHQFEQATRGKSYLIISVAAVAILLVLGTVHNLWIFPIWSLIMTFAFINQTIISDQVLRIVHSDKAATVLSFQGLLRRLMYAVFGPFVGWTSDRYGFSTTFILYAVFMAIVFGLILALKKKAVSHSGS